MTQEEKKRIFDNGTPFERLVLVLETIKEEKNNGYYATGVDQAMLKEIDKTLRDLKKKHDDETLLKKATDTLWVLHASRWMKSLEEMMTDSVLSQPASDQLKKVFNGFGGNHMAIAKKALSVTEELADTQRETAKTKEALEATELVSRMAQVRITKMCERYMTLTEAAHHCTKWLKFDEITRTEESLRVIFSTHFKGETPDIERKGKKFFAVPRFIDEMLRIRKKAIVGQRGDVDEQRGEDVFSEQDEYTLLKWLARRALTKDDVMTL